MDQGPLWNYCSSVKEQECESAKKTRKTGQFFGKNYTFKNDQPP